VRWRIGSVLAWVAMVGIASGCGRKEPVPEKVAVQAAGLPEARKAAPGEAPSTGMPRGEAPDDEVHRGAAMQGQMPPGHPPVARGEGMPAHGTVGDPGEVDGAEVPLRKTGLGSAAELQKALAQVQGDEAKRRFEEAFRWTFSVDKGLRQVEKARAAFQDLLRAQPDLAPAWRGLAYVALQSNFDLPGAVAAYQKALELKPDYPEVHYALAFLYAGSDQEKGREHLKKALELGIQDEQGLRQVYGLP